MSTFMSKIFLTSYTYVNVYKVTLYNRIIRNLVRDVKSDRLTAMAHIPQMKNCASIIREGGRMLLNFGATDNANKIALFCIPA